MTRKTITVYPMTKENNYRLLLAERTDDVLSYDSLGNDRIYGKKKER